MLHASVSAVVSTSTFQTSRFSSVRWRGSPSSGMANAIDATVQDTDCPTRAPPGTHEGLPAARKDQPLMSSPPSTTYDRDTPPDQPRLNQPIGTPCDASGGESVPTTAETEKPPGHLTGVLGTCSRTWYLGTWKKIPRFVHLYLENSYWIYQYKFRRNFRQGSI
eukprot:SAG11_NODE_8340_length_1026_cov_2.788565_1_plen_164_part_00